MFLQFGSLLSKAATKQVHHDYVADNKGDSYPKGDGHQEVVVVCSKEAYRVYHPRLRVLEPYLVNMVLEGCLRNSLRVDHLLIVEVKSDRAL